MLLATTIEDLQLIRDYPEVFRDLRVGVWCEHIPELAIHNTARRVYTVRVRDGRAELDYCWAARANCNDEKVFEASGRLPTSNYLDQYRNMRSRGYARPIDYHKALAERKRLRLEAAQQAAAQANVVSSKS